MRRVTARLLAALVAILFVPVPATAELITLRFSGELTSASSSDPAFQTLFPAGSLALITLSYDTNTAEAVGPPGGPADPTLGSYFSNTFTLDAEIAGHHYFSSTVQQLFYVATDPARLLYDNSITETLSGDVVSGAGHTWRPHYLDFQYGWPGTVLASDALPSSLPSASGSGVFQLGIETCRYPSQCLALGETPMRTRIDGILTGAVSIPEPGTLALVACGAILGIRHRRRLK
jgi:hypothetical protein